MECLNKIARKILALVWSVFAVLLALVAFAFVLVVVVTVAPVVVITGSDWLISAFGMRSDVIAWNTVERFGQFGDSFGVVTSVATVIAFVLLYRTYVLQNKEFNNMCDFMGRQTHSIAEQTKHMEWQAKCMEWQMRWNIVMQLCEQYREMMAYTTAHINLSTTDAQEPSAQEPKVREVPGKDGLGELIAYAIKCAVEYAENSAIDLIKIKGKDILPFVKSEFNPYEGCFRMLHRIFIFIDEQECSDNEKQQFARIPRAMLSNIELEAILINCLTDRGEGMKKFVEKFAILNNYTPVNMDATTAFEFCNEYKPDAFGDNLFLSEHKKWMAENRPDS